MNDAARYDALLEAGHDAPVPCPVCTGSPDASPCGEDCDAIYQRCVREERIREIYAFARAALRLAALYRLEALINGATSDHRIRACVEQVQTYRASIRQWRSTQVAA